VRHAAGTPAAEGDADLDTPQVMDQALHAGGMHLAPGMRKRRLEMLIAARVHVHGF
jgi:hypothetical protein